MSPCLAPARSVRMAAASASCDALIFAGSSVRFSGGPLLLEPVVQLHVLVDALLEVHEQQGISVDLGSRLGLLDANSCRHDSAAQEKSRYQAGHATSSVSPCPFTMHARSMPLVDKLCRVRQWMCLPCFSRPFLALAEREGDSRYFPMRRAALRTRMLIPTACAVAALSVVLAGQDPPKQPAFRSGASRSRCTPRSPTRPAVWCRTSPKTTSRSTTTASSSRSRSSPPRRSPSASSSCSIAAAA